VGGFCLLVGGFRSEAIQRLGYLVDHAIEIADYVPAPEPHHQEADGSQIGVAFLVVGPAMLRAIRFDDQVMFEAGEVGDVYADWMLTSKVDPEFPVSQRPPQQRLGVGLFVTHLSSEASLPLWNRVLRHPIRVSGLGVRVNPPSF